MTTQLPPQDSSEPDEKLPGEAELAALYRQLPQSEPGPALDAAVLRAAAQALAADEPITERRKSPREPGDWVHPKPDAATAQTDARSIGSRRKTGPRWLLALSSAATLVLAAGITWHMREQPPIATAPMSADSVAPAQASNNEPPVAPPVAMPAPAPPPMPPKQPAPRMVATSSPSSTAAALRKATADQQAARASSDGYLANSRRSAAAKAIAPAAAPMIAPQVASESATNAAPPAVAEAASLANMPEAMAGAPAPPAPLADDTTVPNASDTPAQELDKIRQLFAQGHNDEAQQRLTSFQQAHPQWTLPPELRAKLRKP